VRKYLVELTYKRVNPDDDSFFSAEVYAITDRSALIEAKQRAGLEGLTGHPEVFIKLIGGYND